MRAWPMIPLLFCALGVIIAVTAVFVSMTYTPKLDALPAADAPRTMITASVPMLQVNNSSLAKNSAKRVLATSAFVQGQPAYSRASSRGTITPKKPDYDPEFVGTLGRGSEVRVMIIWKPGDPTKTHSVGDITPWGKLTKIGENEIVFQDGKNENTLRLF